MDVMIGAVLGVLLGWGASRTHPTVDAGPIVGVLSGLVGGLIGQAWLGPALAPALAGQALAGAAAGGAIGGLVLAPVVGIGIGQLRRRQRRTAPGDH
ncbi:hypothetical protein [Demequina aestuarii]|uniref:hypothetical protein n=1 Tax=Demequina aestuarii TaxID=327095 RepID=UPI0007824A0F|nr:hypothetical protein [Demequina aestuarii]